MPENMYAHTIQTNCVDDNNDGELLYFKELSRKYRRPISEIKGLLEKKYREQDLKTKEDPTLATFDGSNSDTLMQAGKELEKELNTQDIETEDDDEDLTEDDLMAAGAEAFSADAPEIPIDPMAFDFTDSQMDLVNQTADDAFGTPDASPDDINADDTIEPDLSLATDNTEQGDDQATNGQENT